MAAAPSCLRDGKDREMKEIVVPGIYEKVAVSEEYYEVQKKLMHKDREEKRKTHECHAPSYKNCFGDCEQCKFYYPRQEESYEEISERLASGIDELESVLIEIEIAHQIQMHVRERIKGLKKEDREICECLLAGMTDRAAAESLGLPTMTYFYRKRKLLNRLAEEWADLRELV